MMGIVLVFLLSVYSVTCSNILVLSPITTPSHSNIFKPLVRGLVDRGHFVTYWNGLKPKDHLLGHHNNLTDEGNFRVLYSPDLGRLNSDHQISFNDRDSPIRLLLDIPGRTTNYCTAVYKDPFFKELMMNAEKRRYDLVIVEGVFNECVLPLIQVLDTPFIYMNCFAPPPWLLNAIGSPQAFDHLPHPGSNYPVEMNLWQRTYNSLTGILVAYFHRFFIMTAVDRVAGEMLDIENLKPIRQIEDRYLSLLLTNTHFSINYQLPTSPAVIHVGGMHCRPPQPLPKDLESFVDGSGDAGFIIVSFGSILKGVDMPNSVRHLFMSTFARLPQRIIWKLENTSILYQGDVPENVRLMSWLPQQDLLGHPKARLFITHSGLCSKQEAVYHGVPFIALPVFADQPINAQKAHEDGYAIRLDWDELTQETLYDAIQLIFTDSRYLKRMKLVSGLMRDQIDRPLDRAVYWIEYVIRHQGAPHLRSASRKLDLYQRCLIDVMLLVFVVSLLIGFVTIQFFRSFLYNRNHRWKIASSPTKKLD